MLVDAYVCMRFELVIYLIIINIIAFAVYGIDKYKAMHDKWRISETVLIGLAILGGGIGAVFGMYFWHHKTRKWKFKILIPLFIIIWIVLIVIVERANA